MAAAAMVAGVVVPVNSAAAAPKSAEGASFSAARGTPAEPSGAEIDNPAKVIMVLDGEPTLAALADGSPAPGSTASGSTEPGSTAPGSTEPGSTTQGGTVPLDRRTRQALAQRRAAVDSEHRAAAQRVADAGIDVQDWTDLTELVNAVAVTVDADQVERLRELPGVTDVVPDQQARALTNDSVPLIGAPEVWDTQDPAGAAVRGKGSVVAILDTGIDYTHPDLGAGFGPGHTVIGGYDFVNDDDDPMDDHYHGTHVAGIVAGSGHADNADGSRDGIVGVAPEASLLAYKVLNGNGAGYESDIIAGLQAAVSPDNPHRADVVNMSLGTGGDGTDPLGRAATMAVNMGVVVVAASGNSGPGAYSMGSPAVADGVIAVGASASGITDPTMTMTAPKNLRLQGFRAALSANPPSEPISGELVDVRSGSEADYERVGDVTGKVVAYRQQMPADPADLNNATLATAQRAEQHGAIGIIGYGSSGGPQFAPGSGAGPADSIDPTESAGTAGTSGAIDPTAPAPTAPGTAVPGSAAPGSADPGSTDPGTADPGIDVTAASPLALDDPRRLDSTVVMGLYDLQWDELKEYLADGPVTIEIGGEDLTDRLASFSSTGPTTDERIGVDLVAPGTEILSTIPGSAGADGQVFRLSGTSMAAPHVAGAAALLRQADPQASGADLASRLISTARPLEHLDPTQQGAGRLDVAAAIGSTLIAEPTQLSFGRAGTDSDMLSESQPVRLHNSGTRPLSVRLSTTAADGSIGRATLDRSRVVVPAGGDATVTVRLTGRTPDTDADLSGWLVVTPTTGAPALRLPYLLTVRHLVIQATPDPSDGSTTALVYSPAPLGTPPTLTMTDPDGTKSRVPLRLDHGSWYRAELTGEAAGTYRLSATAAGDGGLRLTGTSGFEVVAADGRPGGSRWEPIGPNNAGGPLSTSAADPERLVTTLYQQLSPWISDDTGRTWRQLPVLPVAGGYGDLVIDPHDADQMWYGVQSAQQDPTYAGAVLRTRDGGATWQRLDVPDVTIQALVGDPDGNLLVAVAADWLLVSRDDGDTWSRQVNPAVGPLPMVAIGGDDLYLGTFRGVWRVPGLVAGEPDDAEQVYTAEDDEQVRQLVADAELVALLDGSNHVIGSTDAGATWQTRYTSPEDASILVMRDGELMVGSRNDHQFFGRDHGAEWTAVPEPIDGAIESDFVRLDDDRLLISSPGGGLFASAADGADPQRLGVQGASVYDLALGVTDSGQRLVGATDFSTYGTALPVADEVTPETAEWGLSGSEAYFGRRVRNVESTADSSTMWRTMENVLDQFFVQRSDDGGITWRNHGTSTELPMDLAVGPDDPDRVVIPFWMLIGGTGLYLTKDNGDHWRKVFHPEGFTTAVIDPADEDRLWLGGPDGLYSSDDFGETVSKVWDGRVDSIEVTGGTIVVGGDVVAVSHDGGDTFRVADTGDLALRVADIVVTDDAMYVGTTGFAANGIRKTGRGVLRSSDGGRTFENVSGGLQNLNVVSLQASPDERWLYAGTVGGGAHRLPLDD